MEAARGWFGIGMEGVSKAGNARAVFRTAHAFGASFLFTVGESPGLAATRIATFHQQQPLTNASGFFFRRDQRLFLVTSRHVLFDEPSQHFPDRIEIELHINPDNLAESTAFSIPLYAYGQRVWRQGLDTAGDVDVAVVLPHPGRDTGAPAGLKSGGPQRLARLVDHVVATGSALAEARTYANRIAMRGPAALEISKLMVAVANGEDNGSGVEALGSILAAKTGDLKEGVAAFSEKRAATFKGEW